MNAPTGNAPTVNTSAMKTPTHPASALETFWRGFCRSCPRCGQGRMFAGYLTVREACEACGMAFEPLRSDDAPPYFTLFIVGHVVISLYLALWALIDIPAWGQAILWSALTVVMSVALLPFVKGGVMAVIYRTKAKG